jgi:hypothetical protein
MVSQAVIIPIAILSAVILISLIFVVWWFPRTWNKGNADERRIIDQQAQYLANLRAQSPAVNRALGGEGGDDAETAPPSEADDHKPPVYVNRAQYRPPVAGMA